MIAVSYLVYFERHVRSSAARQFAAADTSADRSSSAGRHTRQLRRVVSRTTSRTRALAVVCVLFVVSWYPLHALTVVDPGLRQPFKVCIDELTRSVIHWK